MGTDTTRTLSPLVVSMFMLIRLQLQLSHDVLKSCPFVGRQADKLQTEAAIAMPPDNSLFDVDWRFGVWNLDTELQRRPGFHVGYAENAAATNGKITKIPFARDDVG